MELIKEIIDTSYGQCFKGEGEEPRTQEEARDLMERNKEKLLKVRKTVHLKVFVCNLTNDITEIVAMSVVIDDTEELLEYKIKTEVHNPLLDNALEDLLN